MHHLGRHHALPNVRVTWKDIQNGLHVQWVHVPLLKIRSKIMCTPLLYNFFRISGYKTVQTYFLSLVKLLRKHLLQCLLMRLGVEDVNDHLIFWGNKC